MLHSDEPDTIDKSSRMIPKALAGFVPIVPEAETDSASRPEYVLIDDCRITRYSWEMTARKLGKRVATYERPEEFLKESVTIGKDTKIYVDAHLAGGVKGEDVSREIHDLGFSNIFLSTGSHPEEFKGLWWIKAITDKRPPFLTKG